jgi:hypothetical protein
MLCGGFKEVFVLSILNTSGVLALVDSQLEVVKLGGCLHVFRRIYRDCYGSDIILIKVSIGSFVPSVDSVCVFVHALLCDASFVLTEQFCVTFAFFELLA